MEAVEYRSRIEPSARIEPAGLCYETEMCVVKKLNRL
jgi:hypothetical protein